MHSRFFPINEKTLVAEWKEEESQETQVRHPAVLFDYPLMIYLALALLARQTICH